MQTFYWHDYETWGADPSRDRPAQFAGLRTDLNFNPIGDPLMLYCQPPPDLLPQPEACLITGISPYRAKAEGVPERQFIAAVHQELAAANTCALGYNSLRFDDEVTRYTLYRNFFDPYAREWQNSNSRWDLIDMVRACHALRPDGIEWPKREDGTTSFKLEHLTNANGIGHANAHDALSDVHATIALAKLIKQRQPRLFDYLFKLRSKNEVAALLNLVEKKPVLYVASLFPASRNHVALVMPLARHPINANEIICYDLSAEPSALLAQSSQEICQQLFAPKSEQPRERMALTTIRTNRCPVVATARLLDPATAERLGIDVPMCLRHAALINAASHLPAKLRDIYSQPPRTVVQDPEQMLYSGFFKDADRDTMVRVRGASGAQLAAERFVFTDQRLPELLWRYRARNFPETLSPDEAADWKAFCYARLTDKTAGASLVWEDFLRELAILTAANSGDDQRSALLAQLQTYAQELLAACADAQLVAPPNALPA